MSSGGVRRARRSKTQLDGQPSRPSIIAVAQAARVSIATVSRVLNKRGNVDAELERRVRAAIDATGYLPNVAARSLSSGRSRILGVIISNLKNPFFPELLQSFEEAAVALGYEVLVASTSYDLQRMMSCIDRMLERKVDGVAVMTFGMNGPLLDRIAGRGVPLVFMDEAPEGDQLYAIDVDYDHGVRQAIQHLAILGHRRIGLVLGPEQQVSVAKRRTAVDRALREVGLAPSPELVFSGDHSFQSGQQALEALMTLQQPPTAIFCSNDLSALGVMHAAGSKGIRIPEQLSLIGFDGILNGSYVYPSLTSVLMSRKEIAEIAVDTLWRCIHGQPAKIPQVTTELLVRQTTSHPAGTLQDLPSTRG